MDNLKLINEKISENKEEMVQVLKELIQINSEAGKPEKDKPFGKGVFDAFLYMLKKGEKDGFNTLNVDNYGGHIEMEQGATQLEVMGILAHIDVVPAGSDWTTPPYEPVIKDNRIYGRGAADDKGPTIAAYYAMRALKDANIKLNKKVRLVLGLDEETGWSGMEYYLKKVNAPDFGFAPDGNFPTVNGEKGIMIFDLAKKFSKASKGGIELRSFKGGNTPNMVPDFARIVVKSENQLAYEHMKEKASRYREQGYKIKTRGVGKSFEIIANGISSHGAHPEKGENAISILMNFIKDITFNNEGVNEFIEFYNKCIGFELDGESLGIGLEDEISGKAVVNIGMIDMDLKSVRLTVNVRFPVSYDDEVLYRALAIEVSKYNIGVVKKKYQKPIYIDEKDPFIEILMDVYKRVTGDRLAKPQVIGGGTYARAIDNFVAFGATFPGENEVAHQKDEYINIDSMMKATQIYAESIYELCK